MYDPVHTYAADPHNEHDLPEGTALTIELGDTEAVLDALTESIIALGGFHTESNNMRSVHAIELQHLRTHISEATTRTAIDSMIRGN